MQPSSSIFAFCWGLFALLALVLGGPFTLVKDYITAKQLLFGSFFYTVAVTYLHSRLQKRGYFLYIQVQSLTRQLEEALLILARTRLVNRYLVEDIGSANAERYEVLGFSTGWREVNMRHSDRIDHLEAFIRSVAGMSQLNASRLEPVRQRLLSEVSTRTYTTTTSEASLSDAGRYVMCQLQSDIFSQTITVYPWPADTGVPNPPIS